MAWLTWPVAHLALYLVLWGVAEVQGLGSMSSAAAAYGGNGPAFCGLTNQQSQQDGSAVECFGSDAASVYGAPLRLALSGLTAGDGFVCGLTLSTQIPYCWGNNLYVQQGTPAFIGLNVTYTEISAGDNHLCALRRGAAAVDCWGYNMTGSFVTGYPRSFVTGYPLLSITAGSFFTCGLFASNRTVICWGDESGSNSVISQAPKQARFRAIWAGGYHVCGILQSSGATLCWGRPLESRNGFPGNAVFSSLVGGKFHACGLLASSRTPSCWGLIDPPNSTPPPSASQFLALAAGDYYTCGVSVSSLEPLCWGSQFPSSLRPATAVSPDNCSSCSISSASCPSSCLAHHSNSIQTPIIIGELAVAVVVVAGVLVTAIFLVRFKLARNASATNDSLSGSIKKHCSASGSKKVGSFGSSFRKEKVRPSELEEPKMSRAEVFSYQELEQATCGFGKECEVGKGSFSCVFRGVLGDGRVVAVKRAVTGGGGGGASAAGGGAGGGGGGSGPHKDSNEFRNELDLLSRLNHAHLLTLLGFCDERGERLLVYEFMTNGTLHQQIHGGGSGSGSRSRSGSGGGSISHCSEYPAVSCPPGYHPLGWVRRVTIAVQAARGLEYLHGYACPPVIHRDIKSSNILLDDEWNARVSDFGLSLLGPADSDSPLSELPAGTLGYLDPEYYRLHYLTTKSDVYSFGVLLLEILSGRKAIDMQYEEGNIVEWAVPLIKEGQVMSVLDPRLEPPLNVEAIQKIARVAARCVKMKGRDRPSMDKVTTSLERALAMLMGTYSDAQPFLPSEVVLGSSRLHRKSSQKSSCRSTFDVDSTETATTTAPEHDPLHHHHHHHHLPHPRHRPSSSVTTFISTNSSLRRPSLSDHLQDGGRSGSQLELDISAAAAAGHNDDGDDQSDLGRGLKHCLFDDNRSTSHQQRMTSEVYPASPQEQLFLSSNF